MASLKDLRVRIASVKSTQRITSAMKMVAAAKLRRAQELAQESRPYAERMERMLTSVSHLAARGLVWVGLQGWHLVPALLFALGTFALVDGIATYGHLAGWDWTDERRLRWFYAILALIACLEAVAFAGLAALIG